MKTAVSTSGAPTGNAVVVSDAAPPVTVWGLPTGEPPLSNCTEPVMVPETPDVTVAFSVTEVPKVTGLAGLGGGDRVVVVAEAPELMV